MLTRLVILGAGGHAKMVIEAARTQGHCAQGHYAQGQYEPALCLAHPDDLVDHVLQVPVEVESDQRLAQLREQGYAAFVAVGSNRLRRKLSNKLDQLGMPLATIISSQAWISPSASLVKVRW